MEEWSRNNRKRDREREREDKGEREQVAGRRAYGATSVPPYLGKINNLFGGGVCRRENLRRERRLCNAASRRALDSDEKQA